MDVPDNDSGVESDNSHGSFTSDGKSFNAGEIGEVDNDGLIDELDDGDLVIIEEDESDAEETTNNDFFYVGPPKSIQEDKKKWEVHTVDTDPSVFSTDKSYRRDPEVKWNPQEVNRSPIDYFYKAFSKSYIATILENTNAKLAKNTKIKSFNESDFTRMLGIRSALTLDSKKGGLDIHWADYDEDIEGVILGGNFESRFGVSRSRFDKFW